jgi:hypothetical protein
MKTLDLDFIARVKLADILGSATGPLAKITALQAVYAKMRLTEAELATVTQTPLGDGRVSLSAAGGAFCKQIEIEDQQATALLAELDSWHGYQIADLEWLGRVKEQLRAKTTIVKKDKEKTK